MENEETPSDISEKPFDAFEALSSRGKVPDSQIEEFFKSKDLRENLKKIVSERKIETVRKLTENPQTFVVNVSLNLWTEIINLSAEQNFFNIYGEFRKLKGEYERKFNVKIPKFKYQKVLEDISKLHADISEGKTFEVEAFIDKYPKLKLCYGSSDKSALERSIEASNFDIFATLLDAGFNFNENCGPKFLEKIEEKLEEILESAWLNKILESIVKRKKLKLLEKLTENVEKFVENVKVKEWIEISNLAAEEEFFDIFKELQKLESEFEKKFNKNCPEKLDYEYKNVLEDISKFHTDISEGKIEEVESFIGKYPKLKLCYGSNEFCALERSIEARQFHAYAFLRVKGFYSDKGQELLLKIKDLWSDEKEKIRTEILKFTISDPIGLILTKCDLDACSDVLNFSDVRQMLDDLIKIKEIKPVLEILALSDVKIIFDYNEESVVGMDPTARESTVGLAYFEEGILYVGRNKSKSQRYGTFAHEATHFALYLLYENFCLPYRVEDGGREEIWVGIVQSIKTIYLRDEEGTDNIIKWVYKLYDEGYQQNAELIVRVNDLLAFYYDNPRKCEEVREIYAQLFNFYENFVLPDLSIKNGYKVVKLNNDLKLFEDVKDSKFQVKSCESFHLLEFEENLKKNTESLSAKTSNSEELKKFEKFHEKFQNFGSKNFLLLSDVPQLTLSKLLNEISEKSSNKVDVKVKNIFINFEMLEQKNLKMELEEILKSSEILRLIIHFKVDEQFKDEKVKENLKFLSDLNSSVQIFLVASSTFEKLFKVLNEIFDILDSKVEIEGGKFEMKFEENSQTCESPQNALKFLKVNLKNSWKDLTENSQTEILNLKVKFRDENFPLALFYYLDSAPSAEALKFLSAQKNFQVTPKAPKEIKEVKNFIERKFCKTKNYSNFTFDAFIEKTRNEPIVVISDIAGSGKTTLLHKIHQNLNENFPNFWICFVSLLKHKKLLLDRNEISENLLEIVAHKILKLNELERKIFKLKYEGNEVVILFDAYDEVSPDCKLNALKLFKSHKESGKSKIWITTRTHLKVDLERELQVEAFGLAALTSEQQREYLRKYWEETCDDSDLRRKNAGSLAFKLDEMNRGSEESLIGIILLLRLLAEYFKDKLSEDFYEKIKNLNFSQVYEFLLESSVKVKDENSARDLLKLNSEIYETLAVKQFLGIDGHHLFGRAQVVDELGDEKLEELSRDGIIFYFYDQEIFFLHRTVLEFFVWRFVSNRIKNFKKNWKYEKEFFKFLMKLLSSEMTRLDECFKELWKTFDGKSQKSFECVKNFSQSFHNFIIQQENFDEFKDLFDPEISHSTFFVLKSVKFENVKTFQKIIESKYYFSSNFQKLVRFRKNVNPEILGEFLDEVFESYPEKSELFEFLMKNNRFDETVFHKVIDVNYLQPEMFLKFWSKVEEQKFGYEKVLEIFFNENKWERRNIFAQALENFDERTDAILKIIKRNLKVEDQRKLLSVVQIKSWGFDKKCLKYLDYLSEIFEPEEVLKILTSTDEDGRTFLYRCAWNSNQEIIKIIFDELQKLKKENFEEFLKEFLLKRDKNGQNVLMLSCRMGSQRFYIYFELFFKFLTFKDFVYEVDGKGWTILHHLVQARDFEILKFFMDKAEKELTEEEFKSFFKLKTKKSENIFHLIARDLWNPNDKANYFFNKFTEDEMRELLSELDDERRLPLHHAAAVVVDKDVIETFFDLYKKVFEEKKILKFFEMKDKWGINVEQNCRRKDVKEILSKLKEKLKNTTQMIEDFSLD